MPFLADSIETALIRLSYRLRTGISLPGFGLDGISTAFTAECGRAHTGSGNKLPRDQRCRWLAGFFLADGSVPGWILTALLIIAWLGAYEAGSAAGESVGCSPDRPD